MEVRALLTFGTRPEAIKLAPVLTACLRRADAVKPLVCLTGQHRELLAQVTDYFAIEADVELNLMEPNQRLSDLTARCVQRMDDVLANLAPDCVIVQGDTTTVMAASLAAFYQRVPIVHVEAGLRTGNLLAPWPEELNRRIADMVASLHCAPTKRAADVLLAEGIPEASVHVTGNTVIDALLQTVERERAQSERWEQKYTLPPGQPMVLVTSHRRENFGTGLENIVRSLDELSRRFADCRFVWPVHLNPNVREPVHRVLSDRANIQLVDPAIYPEFVWLMDRSTLILTDSGGVQEEAPSLGKPVVVMRGETDRPESVEAGAAQLVGTSAEAIVASVTRLLTDPKHYAASQVDDSPYGDGHAADRIVDLMLQQNWAS